MDDLDVFDFDTPVDRNGYGALKWDRRTDEEKALGVVPMSIADMEFRVAPCVRDMVMRSAENALYGYTDPEARYFEAVKRWLRVRHDWKVETEDIVCLYGVVPAISAAIRAYTAPGDGVIIQTPVYYPFGDMIRSNACEVMENPLIRGDDGRYTMDFDAFEALAAKPNARLFLLCSPHNPVGRVWTRAELKRVSDICARHNVYVASDEIHFDIVLSGAHTPYAKIDPSGLVMTAPSKTFNVPGLQLANIIINDAARRRAFINRVRADGFSNISHFGWAATIGAYEAGDEWLDAMLTYLKGNFKAFREFFERELPMCNVTPLEGTYLAWVDMRALNLRGRALEALTRANAKLVLDEGYIFGREGDGFERFNIALPRLEMINGLKRLKTAVNQMGGL